MLPCLEHGSLALIDAAAGDEAVVTALKVRRVPALEALVAEGQTQARAEGHAEGEAKGLRAAAMALCKVLGIPLGPKRRARLETMGLAELEALCIALTQRRRWPSRP